MTYTPVETLIVNALKSLALGVPVYRGTTVPNATVAPYVLVHAGPMSAPTGNRRGYTGDVWVAQRVYVEIYQATVDARGRRTEDPSLPVRVLVGLDRLPLTGTVTPLVVESSVLIPDPDPVIRHDSITARVEQSLSDALTS